jgi:hypothetical protein
LVRHISVIAKEEAMLTPKDLNEYNEKVSCEENKRREREEKRLNRFLNKKALRLARGQYALYRPKDGFVAMKLLDEYGWGFESIGWFSINDPIFVYSKDRVACK